MFVQYVSIAYSYVKQIKKQSKPVPPGLPVIPVCLLNLARPIYTSHEFITGWQQRRNTLVS